MNISFLCGNQQGSIYISRINLSGTTEENSTPAISRTGVPIRVEGLEVFIFEQGSTGVITYCDALTQYAIYLPFTVDDTMELAKTLTNTYS